MLSSHCCLLISKLAFLLSSDYKETHPPYWSLSSLFSIVPLLYLDYLEPLPQILWQLQLSRIAWAGVGVSEITPLVICYMLCQAIWDNREGSNANYFENFIFNHRMPQVATNRSYWSPLENCIFAFNILIPIFNLWSGGKEVGHIGLPTCWYLFFALLNSSNLIPIFNIWSGGKGVGHCVSVLPVGIIGQYRGRSRKQAWHAEKIILYLRAVVFSFTPGKL